jgi:hypothetical protein
MKQKHSWVFTRVSKIEKPLASFTQKEKGYKLAISVTKRLSVQVLQSPKG